MSCLKKTEKNRNGRLLALAGASILLANPIVGFVDLLPNCFAYLLLCVGLSRVADLEGHICEARRRFQILTVFGIIQLLAVYFGYGVLRSRATNLYELRSYIVLCSFVLLVAHWFYLLPALRELFLGADYLADRYNAAEIGKTDKRGRTPVGRLWCAFRCGLCYYL